ncbi:MarR family winged helix-turn-helix transcriptional regulator [Marinicrinis sediminis]|uniref:MarR family winged helix-turn-helix transcriptional regulator n=1 Tax=Marinicrinis sediminis TaxID=1652465 RepID=A0ABW5REJ6_9BACL
MNHSESELAPDMKLEHQLCFAIYACSREMTRLYRPLLEGLGITYTQYVTLLVLWEQDGLTVKELGHRLLLDSGTLTPLLKKLEKLGVIRRMRDTGDERNVRIYVTEQGKEMQLQAQDIPYQLSCRVGMEPNEARELLMQMKQVLALLHQAGDQVEK